jgi:transposase-like protein
VLRLLAGEQLADVARETGRPRTQLAAWRRQFLEGGRTFLGGAREHPELSTLRATETELRANLAKSDAENRALERRLALLSRSPGQTVPHPYCGQDYAYACEALGAERLHVAPWDAFVFVREGPDGSRRATGAAPFGSLDPRCDPASGLETLRDAGITSFSTITDPLWCPGEEALREAFDICRPLKELYIVDREIEVHVRKRHRNRVNRARLAGEVVDVALSMHLDRWFELYAGNVESRRITHPFTREYFERLAKLKELRTVAVVADGEIVTLSLWLRHADTIYFHDGASSVRGKEISAAYAAFAHVIETPADLRYILLGGASGFPDDRLDGLAVFKRGFANASLTSYLCTTTLARHSAAVAEPGPTAAVPAESP